MQTQIEFIIGSEKRISEIVSKAEIEPLLRSLVKTGPTYVAVLDEDGLLLCGEGNKNVFDSAHVIRQQLLVEGEPKGTLVVESTTHDPKIGAALALLARDALQLIINNNLKRMLTTEVHTAIVQESYDQLIDSNRKLKESEKRYRDLALSLEQQVADRTAELQKAYSRMLQQEKLAAVGSLAAGMAHEINNPTGFIRSNVTTFSRYFDRMKLMLNQYQLLIAANTPLIKLAELANQKRKELKLDYILSDCQELLNQTLAGTERISGIVADLKSFSHVDETGPADVDLNSELEKTLAVLSHQIADKVTVIRSYQPLPQYGCHPGLLAQVFLSIVQNALKSRDTGLELNISTLCEDGHIQIQIKDNGCGMSPETLTCAFDPFFTTREVGSGTGMGLTVAREIIISAGGSIELSSIEGTGTTVTLRLPLRNSP